MPTKYNNRSYWSAIHSEHLGSLEAVGYPGYGIGFNRETYKLRVRALHSLLQQVGFRGGSLLEGAVGVGAYEPFWRTRNVSWTGVDISESAIDDLRRRFPGDHFYPADLVTGCAELTGKRFDLVTAIDVLYHIVDDDAFAAALRNLAKQVVSGGLLVVSDVFCTPARRIAGHVKRRPLEAYLGTLNPARQQAGASPMDSFVMAAREPVFAVLGDPVKSPGSVPDWLLFNTWRLIGKTARTLPLAGGVVTKAFRPLDAILRKSGVVPGRNLELVAFRKQ